MVETTQLHPNLKDVPIRMLDLPWDQERKSLVPWFVLFVSGKPEYRLMDEGKWIKAVEQQLCWCCGKRLGAYLTFVLGPMCGITRTTSEPPNHLACARWAAKVCPFLSRPHMVRRGEAELEAQGATSIGGNAIKRNPGVTLLWTAHDFQVWHPSANEVLIRVGDPESWEWFCQGRIATRAEVLHSIETGLPLLQNEAQKQAGAMEDLLKRVEDFKRFLPGV